MRGNVAAAVAAPLVGAAVGYTIHRAVQLHRNTEALRQATKAIPVRFPLFVAR